MDTIRDILGSDTETPAQPVDNASPQQFNIDPSLGPTWSNLPNPGYQPTTEQAQFRDLADTLKSIPIRSISEAQQAIAFATELEGKLGFDADVRAGVPTHEALMKWAPKLYSRNPAAIAKMIEPPFQPTMTDVGGQKLLQLQKNKFTAQPPSFNIGPNGELTPLAVRGADGSVLANVIPGSRGGVHVLPQAPNNSVKPQHIINSINSQLRANLALLKSPAVIRDQAKTQAILAQNEKLSQELGNIRGNIAPGAPSPATDKVRIKNKKTGKFGLTSAQNVPGPEDDWELAQ